MAGEKEEAIRAAFKELGYAPDTYVRANLKAAATEAIDSGDRESMHREIRTAYDLAEAA